MSEINQIHRIFAPLTATRLELGRIAVGGLVVLGILLRVRQYLFERSLGEDESALALNVMQRSFAGLLRPLDHFQGAPVAFLWLQKLVIESFGSSEFALRLVPVLAGIASMLLFVVAARRLLPSPSIPIAVGLFAISNPLIRYAATAKQYSTDVAIALAFALLARPLLDGRPKISRLAGCSAAGAAAVWFSHPAAFVLAGLGSGALWNAARKRDRDALLKLSLMIAAWLASFAFCYVVSLRSLSQNNGLLDYWKDAFAPHPTSLWAAMWYVDTLFDIFSSPVGLTLSGIAAVAAVIGAWELLRIDQGRVLLLLVPVAVTLAASMLHLYPFQGRLLLFLVPGMIPLIAVGLEAVWRKTRASIPLLGPLLIGLLILEPLADAGRDFLKPEGREEVRPMLEYISRHGSQADLLYGYYNTAPALQYYRLQGLVTPSQQVIAVGPEHNWKLYRDDLDKLRGRNRVWILFSQVWKGWGVNEELLFLEHLDSIGKRLDSARAPGASVYLYDLSGREGALIDDPNPKNI